MFLFCCSQSKTELKIQLSVHFILTTTLNLGHPTFGKEDGEKLGRKTERVNKANANLEIPNIP